MQQDHFSRWEQNALLSRDERGYDTVCFFRHLDEIYALFEAWKDEDRFYFIPLRLRLTYCMHGHATDLAGDLVYLGTFIKTVLEHEDRFTARCPQCGRKLYPYGSRGPSLDYHGSLEAVCSCGETTRPFSGGWGLWNVPFRTSLKADEKRLRRVRFFHPRFQPADIQALLDFLWH